MSPVNLSDFRTPAPLLLQSGTFFIYNLLLVQPFLKFRNTRPISQEASLDETSSNFSQRDSFQNLRCGNNRSIYGLRF